jgi:NTE family protein
VLEANGIVPDIITGTSAGSVVGSLYASGLNGMQLQAKAMQLDESELTDWTLSTKGFLKGEKLENYINTQLGNRPIEKLPRKLGIVATELDSGQKVVFRTGQYRPGRAGLGQHSQCLPAGGDWRQTLC